MVRIDELRIYQRKRQREGLWLSLTLSLMEKDNTGQLSKTIVGDRHVGAIKRFSIKREPFRFDKMIGAPENLQTKFEALAPQPNRDRQLPRLTGILWDDENPIAILSHGRQTLSARVGAVVAGMTLISIQPQHIIVKRGPSPYTLRLWKQVQTLQIPPACGRIKGGTGAVR